MLMRTILEASGVKVVYVENCTKSEFDSKEQEFRDLVSQNYGAIVFFAGHGAEYNNINRLMTVCKADKRKPSFRQDSINLLRLVNRIKKKKPSFTLAILDCCRVFKYKDSAAD